MARWTGRAVRRRPPLVTDRFRRVLRAPQFQLVVAVAGMAGGAWLIAVWVVGVVIMAGCLLLGLDALLRDTGVSRRDVAPVEDVLERYRRAR
jgi:hypothetical protein